MTRLALCALLALPALRVLPVQAGADGWTHEAVRADVDSWANYYGVSQDWLEGVIGCESHFDPYPPGPHIGPAQFTAGTFHWLASISGIGGSAYDPDTNIRVMAWAHANGYSGQWSCG